MGGKVVSYVDRPESLLHVVASEKICDTGKFV